MPAAFLFGAEGRRGRGHCPTGRPPAHSPRLRSAAAKRRLSIWPAKPWPTTMSPCCAGKRARCRPGRVAVDIEFGAAVTARRRARHGSSCPASSAACRRDRHAADGRDRGEPREGDREGARTVDDAAAPRRTRLDPRHEGEGTARRCSRLLELAMRSTSLPLNAADWPAKPAEVGTVDTLLLLRVRSLTGEPEKSSARISDASNTPGRIGGRGDVAVIIEMIGLARRGVEADALDPHRGEPRLRVEILDIMVDALAVGARDAQVGAVGLHIVERKGLRREAQHEGKGRRLGIEPRAVGARLYHDFLAHRQIVVEPRGVVASAPPRTWKACRSRPRPLRKSVSSWVFPQYFRPTLKCARRPPRSSMDRLSDFVGSDRN